MKWNIVFAFLLALVISTLWTAFNRYEYVGNNIFLFNRINVFPLVLWTLGLTLLYAVHTKIQTKYPIFHTTVLYLVCIGLLEAFGYHVLNIRLISHEPSLFGLGIIHAPIHMKVFYIIAGPIFILIADFLFKQKDSASQ